MRLCSISLLISSIVLLLAGNAFAADEALLRITCEESESPIKITINDVPKGECPADIKVSAGRISLIAQQMVDAEYERVFVKRFEIAGGVYKRIEVELSAPRLTSAAQRARQLAEQKREAEEAQRELKAAQDGNIKAMASIASRYANGRGVAQNPEQAQYWQSLYQETKNSQEIQALTKRADAGEVAAMLELSKRFASGVGASQDDTKAQEWNKKAQAVEAERIAKEKKAAAARKRAEIEQRLAQYSMTPNVDSLMRKRHSDLFDMISSTIACPILLVSDILSAPSHTTERKQISDELSAHAAAWAAPESLMAKAYAQHYQTVSAATP